jgi:L-iditol 2-dehydrogenase
VFLLKAAVLYGQKNIRYEEVENPVIGDDEILVRVKVTGICGSDIPRVLGTAAHYYPIILGHEFSGEVVEIGSQVRDIDVGERITGAPLIPCHKCGDCLRGHYSQCRNYSFIGSRTTGSWAEYVKMPAVNAVRLPEEINFIQGTFFEPATVALHGLFVMDFKGGYDIAITGMGTIGLLTLQCAKALGARRIFVFDIDEERLKVAKEYGADVCLNTKNEEFKEIVAQATQGCGFKMVIETAGVEFTERLCLEMAANKGNVMFIGTPSKPISLKPREFEHINRKELTVRGSWMSYSAPFPGREWELAGYYFKKGQLKVEKLIHRIIPMEDIDKAFEEFMIPGKVKGKILMEV